MVGCGLVAQVMHLPHLREMPDRFTVAAVCDIAPGALAHAGSMFPDARRHDRWTDVIDDDLDAVLVLTPGSHAPVAIAAAEAGLHVFAENPAAALYRRLGFRERATLHVIWRRPLVGAPHRAS